MEYLAGGDFFSFLEKRKFRLQEDLAKKITHQVATALYYLHSFGIVHRDVKPENILMVKSDDSSDVKIVDFGLSKTFGPGETCKEPFGTLCYVAPEILLQRPYDKSVDLWSLGVIVHLMLSSTLPFDSEDDREIARKTIYEELAMAHPIWEQSISDEAKDLVRSNLISFNIALIVELLIKNRSERIKLEKVLEHPWIAKVNQKIFELRRKSSDEGDRLMQFMAYTNTDVNNLRRHSPE